MKASSNFLHDISSRIEVCIKDQLNLSTIVINFISDFIKPRLLARWDFESAHHELPVTMRRIKGKSLEAVGKKCSRYISGRREICIRKSWKRKYYTQTEIEEILKIIALKQKDVLAVLPIGKLLRK